MSFLKTVYETFQSGVLCINNMYIYATIIFREYALIPKHCISYN